MPPSSETPGPGLQLPAAAPVDEHGQDVVHARRAPGRRSRRSARRSRVRPSGRRRARRSSFAKSRNQYRARLRLRAVERRALHSPAHVLRLLPREDRRPRARRAPDHAARRGRDARLHARGHGGGGEGGDAARPRGGGRADHPRQHLSPDAAARATSWCATSAGCTASRAGAGPTSPTAAATRSSAWPSCAISPKKACSSRATSTARATCSRPSARWRSSRTWARTSRWPSTSARPHPAPREAVAEATARTTRWARRSREAHTPRATRPSSGSCRAASTSTCASRARARSWTSASPATRSAASRWASPRRTCTRVLAHLDPVLPADKPRYLMGVGTPEDILEGVARGVDMFDCVLPTRNARNGQLFTRARPPLHPQREATAPTRGRPTTAAPATPAARRQPRLPAPPAPGERDVGGHAHDRPQPGLLP